MDELQPVLKQVETMRQEAIAKSKQAMKTAVITAISIVSVGFLITLATNAGPIPLFIGMAIGLFVAIFVYNAIAGNSKRQFKYQFKNQIIERVATYLQPGMSYSGSAGISSHLFASTGHYKTSIDRYNTEDLFHGIVGETEISFAEIHAEEKKVTTDSEGRRKTRWVTIFKGVLFIADFHKHFHTWMTIYPDSESNGFFGRIGQKLQKLGGNLVRLENPTFEKHFVVRCPDEIQARYILTPDMQERLLDLRNSLGKKIKISLQGENLYLTVEKREDWFEPDFSIPATNQSQIVRLAQEMNYFFQIVEILNLNTRIWTKV